MKLLYKFILFAFITVAASERGFAQNTLDNIGLTASTPSASAYSLRKLSSSYSGNSIQVRRSSDNSTQDIGFSGTHLDTTSLKTFVGAGNGFVTIWYDQSGNARNLTQATTSKQPAIVNAGVIYRRNSRPTIYHDATDDGLGFSGTDYLTSLPISVNLIAGGNSNFSGYRRAIQGTGTNNWLVGPYQNQHTWYANGFNHNIATPWSTTNVEYFTIIEPSSNACTSWRNGVSQTTGNSKGTPGSLATGYGGYVPEILDGFISELISFNSELSTTDRQTLESNQNTFYSTAVLSTDATLSALTTTAGTISPTFASATIAYTASVTNATSSVTVTPTKTDANATIQVRVNSGSYATVTSGSASSALSLNVGSNTIDVKVTAQDGTTIKTYTITVTRAAAIGNALHFDGTDDRVSITDNANLRLSGGNFTIEFWAKPTAVDGNFRWVVSKDNGNGDLDYLIGLNTSNQWRFIARNLNVDILGTTTAVSGTWYHIACVFNGTIATLYVNGVSEGTDNTIGSAVTNTANVLIGGRTASGPGQFYAGAVDDLRFWNTAKTAGQISASMNNELLGNESGLVAYYKFNQGTASGTNTGVTTLTDATSNSYNGTLGSFFALTGGSSNWVAGNVGAAILSTDATLSALTTTAGTISPTFAAATLAYTASVSNATSSVTVTPTKTDANATITVNGIAVTSGSASGAIALSVGSNTITVVVTAQDGTTTKTYTITVTRASNEYAIGFDGADDYVVSPATGSTITNKTYTAWVKLNDINQGGGGLVSLETTDGGTFDAIVYNETSNGWGFGSNGFSRTVWSGVKETSTSTWVHIAATYANNSYNLYRNGVLILTTSSFGITSMPNTSHILIGKRHTGGGGAYLNASIDEVSVWNTAKTQAEIQAIMASSINSSSSGLIAYYKCNDGTGITALDATSNALNGTLTNGPTWVAGYTYAVSTDATLSALTTTAGTISPTFAAATVAYTASVTNATTSVTVTPTKTDANATIQVRVNSGSYGTVTSGSASSALSLNVGSNTIDVKVTAQDGTTIKTYTITVTRAAAIGNALDFDGTDDYVDAGTGLSSISNYTLEANVYYKGGAQWLLNFCDGTLNERLQLEINSGQLWSYNQSAAGGNSSFGGGTINTNTWYHVAITNSTTSGKTLYINGVAVATNGSTISPSQMPGTTRFNIGRIYNQPYYFNGTVDEVRVWNVVRTQAQIAANMNTELSSQTGLIGLYHFNQGTAGGTNTGITTATDASGNSNNGTLNNFALTGSTSNWVAGTIPVVATSTDATLSALTTTAGTISPTFAAATLAYTASVANATTSVTVTPTKTDANATIQVRVNSGSYATVTSGSASSALSLNVGSNTIDVKVTAQDGTTIKTYTITVTRAGSTDATLSALTTTAGTIAPTFASATIAYTASVANATTSVTVTPTKADANATITVNGTAVTSGSASGAIALNVGSNTITVVVTAQDGTTIKTYTITVTRAANLIASGGNITYSGSYTIHTFTATGAASFNPPVTSNIEALVVAGGGAGGGTSGPTSGGHYNGGGGGAGGLLSSTTYSVTAGTPVSVTVGAGGASVTSGNGNNGSNSVFGTMTATGGGGGGRYGAAGLSGGSGGGSGRDAGPGGTGTVGQGNNGGTGDSGGGGGAGAAGSGITGGNGISSSITGTATYYAGGGGGTGASNSGGSGGLGGGGNGVNSFVNGNASLVAGSGTPNTGGGGGGDGMGRPTGAGGSGVVIVKYLTGATTTSVDASGLTISSGSISPSFNTNTLAYTTSSVTNATSSVTVTPTVVDAANTIQVRVNGGSYATVTNGSPSSALLLNVGSNTIDTKVSAADGTTKRYTITIIRAAGSTDATLSALTTTAGTISPTFASATVAYTASVTNATTSVTVTPTKTDANATIQVRVNSGSYGTVTSGSASSALSLNVGSNTIDVKVTAQDGTTIKTYTITVTRAAGNNSLHFNSANSNYVSTGISNASNSNFTMEFWLNPTAITDDSRIISSTTGGTGMAGLRFQSGKVQCWDGGTWFDVTTSNISTSTWTHIAIVGNGTQILGYVNGVLQVTRSTSSFQFQGLGLGAIFQGGFGTYYSGAMDEFRFWNVVRTGVQISASFNTELIGNESGLIRYYNFNQGIAAGTNTGITTVIDASSSVTNGTLNGFALTGNTGNFISGFSFTPSTNANLSALTTTAGTIAPTFAAATTAYTATVTNPTTSVTVTPTVVDATATIQVRVNSGSYGTVTSGSASSALSLNIGSNTIDVKVTAQDGTTIKTYTITVTRLSGNILDNTGLTATTIPASAYSLRKLSSTYTGNAITVRRSSDNATQSIGFTAGGDLDSTALKTFVTSGNAFVTTWFDQSGNSRDLTQATQSMQPAIVNAGVIYRRNGKPTIYHDATDDGLGFGGSVYLTSLPVSVNLVAGSNGNNNAFRRAIQGNSGNNWLIGPYNNQHTWYANNFNHQIATPWSTTSVEYMTVIEPVSNPCTSWRNGVSQTTGNGKGTPGMLVTGYAGGSPEYLNGFISEIISFNSELGTTDRQTLETSQSTYYPVPSSNANLSSLTLSTGTLAPTFASGTIAYTASVANATSSVTVTPTVTDVTASVQVRVNSGSYSSVTSGSASAALTLNAGSNTIDILVSAQDGSTSKIYTITVTRAASSNADLSALTLSSGTLNPTFAASTTSYTASVTNATSSITVTPTKADANASIAVNGSAVTSGSASGAIALSVGTNTITVVVTAQDASTKTYTITVTRAQSSNADLSNLTISSGTLSPTFSAATTSYTASVGNATTSITVTPTKADANASITVNGTPVTSGSASGSIALSVGTNTITVVVTAQDASTKTYTVTVTRAQSSNADLSNLTISSGTLTPTFAAATTSYTASVGNATSSITVTPTKADANASIAVNGSAVTSGSASGAIALSFGTNTITVVVTAQDASSKTYTVTITRAQSSNADLSALTLSSGTLNPAFVASTTSYTASVGNATSSITVTPTKADANASITVNGTAVTSGSASGAIALSVGTNTITVVVTAQDASTKTYTVTVTRAQSSNADLSALTLSSGTLSPTFAASTTSYTASVTNATSSITVTPTKADANASIAVNGSAVTSGSASGAIALSVGTNTITVVVTAQDASTKTYTITVSRQGTPTWVGTSNSSWSNPANWNPANVPTSLDIVTIPSGTPNDPNNSGSVTVTGLTVATGVTITNSGTITITDALNNGGSITGTVVLNGSSAQNISGTGTIANLTLNNAAGATITTGVTSITGTYTPTAGTLTTNGNLVLVSNVSGTARIAAGTGTYLNGNVTIQRYIPGGGLASASPSKRAYRFVSHPFSNAIALSQLKTTGGIDITGSGGAANGFSTNPAGNASNNPSVFWYNTAAGNGNASADPGWTAYTNATTSTNGNANSWNQYQGIRAFVRGTQGQGLDGSTSYIVGSPTISLSGAINTGDKTVSLVNGGANWNLVGNPYPSAINLNLASRTNTSNFVYVWKVDQGVRGAYSIAQNIGTGAYNLPAYSAFFVQTTGTSPSIAFHELDKTGSVTTDVLFRTAVVNNTLKLKLQSADGSIFWDELHINFNKEYKDLKEVENDGLKLANPDVSLYSISSDNEKLSVDSRPIKEGSTIPLGLLTAQARSFKLTVTELSNAAINEQTTVYLKDKYLSTLTKLETGTTYEFTTTADAQSQGEQRFELVQKVSPALITNSSFVVKVSPNPVADVVTVSFDGLNNKETTSILVVDMNGKTIKTINLGKLLLGNESINIKSLSSGTYTIVLLNGDNKQAQTIIKL